MYFSLLLFSASAFASALHMAHPLFNRQSQLCFVLPIAPTSINGNVPCGSGSIVSECMCCADGQTTCSKALQTCQLSSFGGYICVDSPALSAANNGGGGSGTTATAVAPSPSSPPTTTSSAVSFGPSSASPTTAGVTTSPGNTVQTFNPTSGNLGVRLAFSSMLGGAAIALLTMLSLP
jgi:hypothetical protein